MATRRVSTSQASGNEGRDGNGPGLLGMNRYASGVGGDWHPTVVYLIVLILLEAAALAGLRYFFNSVHGG